ncbi:tetratricopeptide repeat protein [Paenibacillus solisilvae]|uniref:Tetratricopeptide repeat protein n=1 Tax=Paenibacillus solisilvae TaxID=2486751 RepID=A0ABW0VQ23_9BACL
MENVYDGIQMYKQVEKINHLLQWRRYDEALQEAGELLREYPENAFVFGITSMIHRAKGNEEQALYWANEALARDPEQEDAWCTLLFVAYNKGEYKEAQRLVFEMLRMFPEESYLYRMKSQCELREGRFEEARSSLELALSIETSAINLAMYSYVMALLGHESASIQAENSAMRMEPENDQVLLQVAWAADKRGDHKKASEYMNAAVRLDPDNEQIRKEYLDMLQKSYWFYRVLLYPGALFAKYRWQALVIWLLCAVVFNQLIVLFIVLYILSYWTSKALVNVKVYGWGGIWRRKS